MRALVLLVLVSCASEDPRWVLRFDDDDPSLASTTTLHARILEGGCEGSVVLHEVSFEGEGPPEQGAPLLDAGRYGFSAEAIGDDCRIRARGCVEVDLPSSDEIIVPLASGPDTALCPPASCSGGVCADHGVAHLSTGRAHSCASDFGGRLYCWGHNDVGQVGDGDPSDIDRLSPVLVAEDQNISALSSGGIGNNWRGHSCAIEGGAALCWGYNAQGQIGDGTNDNRPRPTRLELDQLASISAGGQHTCAASEDGVLTCWGSNEYGQLGIEGAGDESTPSVVSVRDVVAVASGEHFSCVRRIAGTVSCFGRNDSGQLGDGSTESHARASSVSLRLPVIDVAAGSSHACAILNDNTVWCWGNNDRNQLGEGGAIETTAVQVGDIDDGLQLGLGSNTSCVRRRDGAISCWGHNSHGQLGQGVLNTAAQATPVEVMGIDDALLLDFGADHGCAIRASGELWCWGRNQYGRLGDGTMEDRATPVFVLGRP